MPPRILNPTPLNIPSPQTPKTLVPRSGDAAVPATERVILSTPQIVSAYNQLVLAGTPKLFWPLDESGGAVAADLSGNGFNGVYTAPIVYSEPGLVLDGSTSIDIQLAGLVRYSGALGFGTGSFSMVLWAKLISAGTPPEMVAYGLNLAAVDGGLIQLGSDGALNAGIAQGNIGTYNGEIVLDTRYMLVLTFDGANCRVYKNATLLDTFASAPPGAAWDLAQLSSQAGDGEGRYQKFALYDTVLSGAEILALYNQGITEQEAASSGENGGALSYQNALPIAGVAAPASSQVTTPVASEEATPKVTKVLVPRE